MAKIAAILLLVMVVLLPSSSLASAMDVSSTDLIEKARELDGREVTYTGEVIGDIMVRGDHTWINVSDGVNAVGVWTKNHDTQGVTLPGRYGVHGDEVRISGLFRRACPEHGGDLDIHAVSVQVLHKGYPVNSESTPWKVAAAAVLALANMIFFTHMIRKRHRHPSCLRQGNI